MSKEYFKWPTAIGAFACGLLGVATQDLSYSLAAVILAVVYFTL